MSRNNIYPISINCFFIILNAVFLTTIFHELAHWAIGEALGNKMMASLNAANPVSEELHNEWNRNYISGAGPIFTLIQAIFFYF